MFFFFSEVILSVWINFNQDIIMKQKKSIKNCNLKPTIFKLLLLSY